MSRLRWGILATGWIADLFTGDLRQNGFTVAAVASRSADKAAAFAARHGIGRWHGSYEALAADPDVDVVYIATPHPFHAAAAAMCIASRNRLSLKQHAVLSISRAASSLFILPPPLFQASLSHHPSN